MPEYNKRAAAAAAAARVEALEKAKQEAAAKAEQEAMEQAAREAEVSVPARPCLLVPRAGAGFQLHHVVHVFATQHICSPRLCVVLNTHCMVAIVPRVSRHACSRLAAKLIAINYCSCAQVWW